MIEVLKYSSEQKQEWNSFIEKSKNGTFMFYRDFMDYHSDRFEDFSLMIYRKGKLVSCLPANIVGDEIHSHQGLTYGGFVFNNKMRLAISEEILSEVISFYKSNGIITVFIKQVPSIYHKQASNEMDYWLWNKGAKVFRKDTTLTVDLELDLRYSSRKKRYYKKSEKQVYSIGEDEHFSEFWDKVLNPNLLKKYGVKSVHSLPEIKFLKSNFIENIIHYNVLNIDREVVAGTTLFINDRTIHAQYISSTSEGTKYGALDFLFINLIEKYKEAGYKYFDFGICNENGGKYLNNSLVEYKEGFGASTFIHDFYKLEI